MIKDKIYLASLLAIMLSSTTRAAYYQSNGECELHTDSDYYDYYCDDELVKLDNVVCTDKSKKPNYYFPNIKLSWLESQKYCQDHYKGNLANHGLETQAARRALAIRFNTQDDFSVGFRRVNGAWLRVDGSVIDPPLDNVWYPEFGYPLSTPGYDYMRLRGYQHPHNKRLGLLWNHQEHHIRFFICESFKKV